MTNIYVAQRIHVVVADVAVENGQQVVSEVEGKKFPGSGGAIFSECKVTEEQAWKGAIGLALQTFAKLGIVASNADTTSRDVPETDFDKIVAVDMKSIFRCVANLPS